MYTCIYVSFIIYLHQWFSILVTLPTSIPNEGIVNMYIYVYIYVHKYIYVYVYIYIYMYIYICVYIYIYINILYIYIYMFSILVTLPTSIPNEGIV
jgi:hypothetical protein